MIKVTTKIRALAAMAAAFILAGCATTDGTNATVTKSGFSQSRVVDIAPHSSACNHSGLSCIGLGAQWDSGIPSMAILKVHVSNRIVGISGAALNVDGEVHDLRMPVGSTQFNDIHQLYKSSTRGYSVPLDLIKKIANSRRSWVRVHGTDGYTEDMIVDGKDDSKAYHALKRFIATVEAQR